MVLGISDEEFLRISERAEEAGLRLEIIQDMPVWELLPSPIHSEGVRRFTARSGKVRKRRRAAANVTGGWL